MLPAGYCYPNPSKLADSTVILVAVDRWKKTQAYSNEIRGIIERSAPELLRVCMRISFTHFKQYLHPPELLHSWHYDITEWTNSVT